MNQTDLNKQSHESILDYIYRICDNKDSIDLNWSQVAELINENLGYTYSESWYRKHYKAHSFPLVDYNASSSSIDAKLIELQHERINISDERAQNRQY